MSNEAGDKNRSRRRSLFRGSKTPERDFDNLTSYPAPRQLYKINFEIRTSHQLYLGGK